MAGQYRLGTTLLCITVLVVVGGIPIDPTDVSQPESERCTWAKSYVEEGAELLIRIVEDDTIPEHLRRSFPSVPQIKYFADYEIKPMACMAADAEYVEDLDEATGGLLSIKRTYNLILNYLKSLAGSVPQFFGNSQEAFLKISEFLKVHGYPALPLQPMEETPAIFFEDLQTSLGQNWLNFVLFDPTLHSQTLTEEELNLLTKIIMGAKNIPELSQSLANIYQGPGRVHYSIHSYLELQKEVMSPGILEWVKEVMVWGMKGITMAQEYGLFDLQEREPFQRSTGAPWF